MLRVPSSIQPHQFQSLTIQRPDSAGPDGSRSDGARDGSEMTFVAYRSDVYPERNEIFFEEHAVVVVLEGEKKFSSPTQELHVRKGDILFFQRGCYSMNESIDVNYRSLVFFVNERLLKEFVSQHLSLFQRTPPVRRSPNRCGGLAQTGFEPLPEAAILSFASSGTSIPGTFTNFIQSLLPYFGSRTPYLNELLRLKFQELMLHLFELDTTGQLRTILWQLYQGQKTDLDYLMSTYLLKPLSMNELARISGRSLSAFKRDFEEHFHSSPGHWIRRKRLEHAHFLLRNTDKNVSEVSMEIGYESVSHFIKAYKLQYGFTPKRALAAT